MLISKIGKYHIDTQTNRQDAGFAGDQIKFVADGCGSSQNSEVGAQLAAFSVQFAAMQEDRENLSIKTVHQAIFDVLFGYDFKPKALEPISVGFLRDYLLFTALLVQDKGQHFEVESVGDGFIIEVHNDNTVTYHELGVGAEYTDFYGYNYLPRERLSVHKEEILPDKTIYQKSEYKNIGVASDVLRFLFKMPQELQDEFKQLLLDGKELMVKLFINRNHSYFQDDITIAL